MVDYVSTQAVSSAMRLSILQMQQQLVIDQKETTSGQVADVGLSLGDMTGQVVSLQQQQTRLQGITTSNNLVSTRLDSTQTALTSLQTDAQNFLQALTEAQSGTNSASALQSQAAASLQSMTSDLNTTAGGEYIFAGINTDVQPMTDYFQTPPGAAAQAVATAFSTAFGVSQTSAGVANIGAGAMQTFLDSTFSQQFQGASWSTNWSSASSQNIRSRISSNQLVDTSVNANDPAMQQLAQAYTMVGDLGIQNMSATTAQTVIAAASKLVSQALAGITNMQASVGVAQQSVTNANNQMSLQQNVLTTQLNNLISVDPYTATTNMSNLTTQIETAYSLTAQLQQLSLVKYL